MIRPIAILAILASPVMAALNYTPTEPHEHQACFVTTDAKFILVLQSDTPIPIYRMEDGRYFFSPENGPGTYTVVAFGEFGQNEFQRITFRANSPTPDPVPPTPPGPVVIDDTLGVGQFAYDTAKRVGDPEGAHLYGRIFAAASDQLRQTPNATEAEIQKVVDKIAASAKAKLNDPARWQEWADGMAQRFADKNFVTSADHQKAFTEVSKALEWIR